MISFRSIHLPQTDSTNTHLTHLSHQESLPEFTIVQTDYQTSGKGQRGNSWESEKGKNLLFSLLLYPEFLSANRQFLLSQIASLSIAETLNLLTDGISIKWPNDIYWKDKKICGMLIENDLMGSMIRKSIIGVGVNVNQEEFVGDAPNPVSLWQITHKEYEPKAILEQIAHRIYTLYNRLKAGDTEEITQKYHDALYRKEGYHEYMDKEGAFRARIDRVLPEGTLVLIDEMGKKRQYAFKEVKVKLPTLSNPL